MTKKSLTTQIAFRIDAELDQLIEEETARLKKEMPGISVSRSDAIRLCLSRGLEEREKQFPSKHHP